MTPQLNKVHTHPTHTHALKGCLLGPVVTFSLPDSYRQRTILWDPDALLSFALSPFPYSFPFLWSSALSPGDGRTWSWRLDRWRLVIHLDTFRFRFAPVGMVWWRRGREKKKAWKSHRGLFSWRHEDTEKKKFWKWDINAAGSTQPKTFTCIYVCRNILFLFDFNFIDSVFFLFFPAKQFGLHLIRIYFYNYYYYYYYSLCFTKTNYDKMQSVKHKKKHVHILQTIYFKVFHSAPQNSSQF